MIEIAKVEGSGLFEVESGGMRGGGTGIKVDIRDNRDVFCTEYSGSGPSGVWILTARPLKQGMLPVAAQILCPNFLRERRFRVA